MSKKKTQEEFLKQLNEKNINLICLDKYIDARTKIKFQCKKCGYIFSTTPDSVLRGSSCAKCKGILKKTHKEFVEELKNINENIQIIGEYQNNRTKLLCKCNRCNYEFNIRPSDLLKGISCPKCYHKSTSFIEQCLHITMCDIFGEENVVSRDTKTIGKELDTYIPSMNIAIEYGSWFWHKYKIDNDYEKLRLCNSKNIDLIIIYDSYDNKPISNSHFITIKDNISRNDNAIIDLLKKVLIYFDINYTIDNKAFDYIKKRAFENSSRKNTDDFKNEVKPIHPFVEIIGKYKTAKTPIECKCLICNCIWTPTPDNLLRGQGCPDCGRKSQIEKATMSYNDFIQSLGNNLNPNVNIIKESYVDTRTKVDCICNICGFNWKPLPTDLRHGSGCPKCANNMQKTNDEFIKEIETLNYDIEILGTYINHRTPILTKCTKCNHIWSPQPKHLLKGHLCPKCGGTMKRTIEDMQQELNDKSYNITIIGNYINADTPMRFKCNECNYEWGQIYRNLKKSRGCPKCFPYTKKQDEQWLKMYEFAKEYYNEFGNLNISSRSIYKGIKLGSWIHKQKQSYNNQLLPKEKQNKKIGSISEKRIKLLENIGIHW